MSAARERAELFSRLTFGELRRVRESAASRGDLALADEAHAALHLRERTQNAEIEHGGRLYEHIEPPSPQNGSRFITTYYGDPMEWMRPFMSAGAVVKINRTPDVVARQTVDLKAGERVQVVAADGTVRST